MSNESLQLAKNIEIAEADIETVCAKFGVKIEEHKITKNFFLAIYMKGAERWVKKFEGELGTTK